MNSVILHCFTDSCDAVPLWKQGMVCCASQISCPPTKEFALEFDGPVTLGFITSY